MTWLSVDRWWCHPAIGDTGRAVPTQNTAPTQEVVVTIQLRFRDLAAEWMWWRQLWRRLGWLTVCGMTNHFDLLYFPTLSLFDSHCWFDQLVWWSFIEGYHHTPDSFFLVLINFSVSSGSYTFSSGMWEECWLVVLAPPPPHSLPAISTSCIQPISIEGKLKI